MEPKTLNLNLNLSGKLVLEFIETFSTLIAQVVRRYGHTMAIWL